MEKAEYKNIYDHEEGHFFYVSTHFLVLALVKRYMMARGNIKILDVGCGTGGLASKLSGFGTVTGVDNNDEALKFARKRGVRVVKASAEKLPFKEGEFDLVTCIDVIYHQDVKDDVAVLAEMRRVLKIRGILILRVPANKYLMSAHDRRVYTARRYGKKELKEKLKRAGLNIRFISFVHSPIFLVSLPRVVIERIWQKSPSSSITTINPFFNKIITILLNLEAKIILSGGGLPFGQGLMAVATK